jgi:hypothetical protein
MASINININTFAEALVRQREDVLHLPQAAMGPRFGHNKSNIGRYESGQTRPHLAHVDQLAQAYELEPNRLRALLGYPPLPEPETTPSRTARLLELETKLARIEHELGEVVLLVQQLRDAA